MIDVSKLTKILDDSMKDAKGKTFIPRNIKLGGFLEDRKEVEN